MRTAPLSLALLLFFAAAPALANPCPKGLLGAMPGRIANGGTTVAWRTEPAKIAVGKPFRIETVACIGGGEGRGGAQHMAPSRIRVDAAMPMHGHGMNYTPGEKKRGPGHSTFDGLVFHMPGEWQITFDIYDGDTRRRLTRNVTVGR